MTVEEYLDHLLKLGMGWLGWTEEQTLATSMPAIVIAYEGRLDMLQALFGSATAPAALDADEKPPERDDLATRIKGAFRALQGRAQQGMR